MELDFVFHFYDIYLPFEKMFKCNSLMITSKYNVFVSMNDDYNRGSLYLLCLFYFSVIFAYLTINYFYSLG